MDYNTIRTACAAGGSTCPAGTNPQVWRRMRRVASDAKLSQIDPALLPTSLSALIELARLPIARILELGLYGVLGPGLTARRIRSIGRSGAFTAMAEVVVDPETGQVEVGRVVSG